MTEEKTAKKYAYEPHWHVRVAVLVALVLQLVLPQRFVVGPRFLLPVLEAVLLIALFFTTPKEPIFRSVLRRVNALSLIAVITLVNVYALSHLVQELLAGGIADGSQLILSSLNIYLTNIIIFGLWYYELDGGGHGVRRKQSVKERDFLFPQMSSPDSAPDGWTPTFVDYLYVSVTNATAFSPTDTMPMTRRAKLLMTSQAFVALVTIALVAARAVNILK